jgi:hypothetical protein
MSFTLQFGGPKREPVWPLILVLLSAFGCSRPATVSADQSTVQGDHQAPFQPAGRNTGSSKPIASTSTSESPSEAARKLPFNQSPDLPAGTLVTVRLANAVYAESSISSASFEGVVVEPIVINGEMLILRGAAVSGVVESVRASEVKPDRGYVRLTLQSIEVGGSDVPIHTASLFAPQAAARGPSPSLIRLEQGRQLTFRVTEPVFASTNRAKNGR